MWTPLPLLAGVLLLNPTAAQFLVPPGFDAVSYCILQQSQADQSGDCASAVLFQGYQRSTTEEVIDLVEPGLWWPQVAKRVQEVADEWTPMIPQENRKSEQRALSARSVNAMARLPGRVMTYASVVEDSRWRNVSGAAQRLPLADNRPGSHKDGHRHTRATPLHRSAVTHHNNGSLLTEKQVMRESHSNIAEDGRGQRNATTSVPPQQQIQGGNAGLGGSFSNSRNNRLALLVAQAQALAARTDITGNAASRTTNSSSRRSRQALLERQDGQWHNAMLSSPSSTQNVTGRSSNQEHWRVAFLSSLSNAFSHARRLLDDGDGYTQTLVLIGVNLVLGILLCVGLAAAFRGRSTRDISLLGGGPAQGQQSPRPQKPGTVQPPKRLPPASTSPRPPDSVPFRERGEPFEPRIGGITSPHPEPRDLSLRGKMNAAATLAASPLLMSGTPSRSIEDSAARDDRPSIIDAILCVGLIVPEECECTLLVPHLAPRAVSTQVTIEDIERTPALKAVFHLPTQDGRCLILADVDETSNMFAYCVRDFSNLALTIYGAEERHFGLIRLRGSKPSAGFEVITRKQAQLHIRCATSGEPRTFTDGHGRLLAVAEPLPDEHSLRVVRIGPGVDAGLVVLATLASDLLKAMLALEANAKYS